MTPLAWPCAGGEEYALAFDKRRPRRLLIVPALFDEGNRMRRLTVETMRRLDAAGIDSFLPDLPGTNESLLPLEAQTCTDWREATATAARHFGATHVLGIRGGCLFTPAELPCRHYAPVKGSSVLRQMIRARIVASREAGVEETTAGLMELAVTQGIELAGYWLGAGFIGEFKDLEPQSTKVIEQSDLPGPGLWLRAEPGDSGEQADVLARAIVG